MPALHARIAVVLVALGVAAAAWLAGDGAGARAAVGQATGPLVATAPGDAAVLVAENLAPGDTRSGDVTVTNVGDVSGGFALSTSDLIDTGAPLSGVLELGVDDVTAGRAIYSGPLGGLADVALGMLAQGEAHRYRFTVRFPDSVDNAYQGASTAVTFVWSTTAVATSGSGPSDPSAAPTASSAAPVTAAGTGRIPHSAIGAAYRQSGAHGRVTTWVSCEATCRIALSGTAAFDARKLRLRTVRATLRASGRVNMRMMLPRAARQAVSRGRRVTVRLRARATIGGRVVVTRRTILVARSR